jgi:hypothetical protein
MIEPLPDEFRLRKREMAVGSCKSFRGGNRSRKRPEFAGTIAEVFHKAR